MTDKARQYTPSTKRRLDTLSGNQCAAPNCSNSLIARDNKTIISNIAHIEAASENGPRYNSKMTDDERRHFDNLILLCAECHEIIDNKENEYLYPLELLKEWKVNHESKQLSKLTKNPSLLIQAINAIANTSFDELIENENHDSQAFNIEDKITYNEVKRNRTLIDEYKIYYTKINALYSELEEQGSFKKENLLRNIKNIYLKVKGKYVLNKADAISIIKNNADNIIEDIENELLILVEKDNKNYCEDVSFGISIIMIDAFMRCKILEEPRNDNQQRHPS